MSLADLLNAGKKSAPPPAPKPEVKPAAPAAASSASVSLSAEDMKFVNELTSTQSKMIEAEKEQEAKDLEAKRQSDIERAAQLAKQRRQAAAQAARDPNSGLNPEILQWDPYRYTGGGYRGGREPPVVQMRERSRSRGRR
eukprot:TRINITY_DN121963_c0_g1_i1.p1 TRINITY_DN121963_c0_g1~~TRINITY_DN121963_c0_g1_i1.p1  ORF type:complete len:140 (-),score=37.59 TRINITY_DN121963_c0_g1_i1:258-677(-)